MPFEPAPVWMVTDWPSIVKVPLDESMVGELAVSEIIPDASMYGTVDATPPGAKPGSVAVLKAYATVLIGWRGVMF